MSKPNITAAELANLLFAFLDYANENELNDLNAGLFNLANDNCPQGAIAKVAHFYNTINTLNEAGVRQCDAAIENAKIRLEDIKKNSQFFSKEAVTEPKRRDRFIQKLKVNSQKVARHCL